MILGLQVLGFIGLYGADVACGLTFVFASLRSKPGATWLASDGVLQALHTSTCLGLLSVRILVEEEGLDFLSWAADVPARKFRVQAGLWGLQGFLCWGLLPTLTFHVYIDFEGCLGG